MADVVRNLDGVAQKIKETDNPTMWDDFIQDLRPYANVCGYRDDFLNYDTGHWVVTETNASCTQALSDARNGILVLTSIGTEDHGTQIQLGNSTTGEAFAPASGKNIWFECRIASNDVDQNDFFVGLHVQDTSIIAGRGTDYIGFSADDESTNLNSECASGGTESTEAGIATLADGTYVKLGFKVTGTTKVEYYVNDVLQSTLTTNIPTALMQLSIAHLTGEAAANTLSIDYVCCYQSR